MQSEANLGGGEGGAAHVNETVRLPCKHDPILPRRGAHLNVMRLCCRCYSVLWLHWLSSWVRWPAGSLSLSVWMAE